MLGIIKRYEMKQRRNQPISQKRAKFHAKKYFEKV